MWFHVFPGGIVSACQYPRDFVLRRRISTGLALEESLLVRPGNSSWSDICSISSSFFRAFMAFENHGSVDIKYSPVTEDMKVRLPSNFLRDGASVFDSVLIVHEQCKSASTSFPFPSCIFQL